MRAKTLTKVAAGAIILAGAFPLAASAHTHHHHRHHHHHHWRPLTVRKHHHVVARDPFVGPAAIVTGPNQVAATVVSLPFRAVNTVFPPYGNPATNPLVLVGGPVFAAGHIAELPFVVVGSAFGAPPVVAY